MGSDGSFGEETVARNPSIQENTNSNGSFYAWINLKMIFDSPGALEGTEESIDYKYKLLHPDSLKPFTAVLHPDNLETFHPLYEVDSVLLTESGSCSVSKDSWIKLQRVWQNLDKMALSSPRPSSGNDWTNTMKRYKPAASFNSTGF